MKVVIRLLLLVTILAIGWWIYYTFFPGTQEAIRRRLVKVAQLTSFTADEGNISKIASVQKLALYFAEDVEIAVDVPGHEAYTFRHRSELMQAVAGARSSVRSIDAKLLDIQIAVGADGESATADATGVATIAGDKDSMVQRFRITLKKIDGAWVITKVEKLKMPGE